MKCEGDCKNYKHGRHGGEAVLVHVFMEGGKDWGTFTLCEFAIEEDRARGFTVQPIEAPIAHIESRKEQG